MDRFSSLPLELKLHIWKILDVSFRAGWYYRFKLEAKSYGNVMVLNSEWFHFFAPYVYRDEIQLSTVLSNNLDDKSEANIKRIEKLYANHVTTIGTQYSKKYTIFWECLDAFNYEIGFPNLKVLGMCINTQLTKAPRIPVTHDLDQLVFYQKMNGAVNYRDLEGFCSQFKLLGINIDTVSFSHAILEDRMLLLCSYKPVLRSKVRSIECQGYVIKEALEFLATNESSTSLSLCRMIPTGMSPAVETLLQRLTFLNIWLYDLKSLYAMDAYRRVTLPNLRHLCTMIEEWDLPKTVRHIPVICPNVRHLDILVWDMCKVHDDRNGELLPQAFNDYSSQFSAKLRRLTVGVLHCSSIIEQFIGMVDWSRYPNISHLALCCNESAKHKDRLNTLITLHAPHIQDVALTSEWAQYFKIIAGNE